jgi:hypothetical protein
MRQIFTFFLALLCFHVGGHSSIYILGYPRSGTHWFCYSISQILDCPIVSEPNGGNPRFRIVPGQKEDFDLWYQKSISTLPENALFFSHKPSTLGLAQANPAEDFLIVVVRDYHECFGRNSIHSSCPNGEKSGYLSLIDWYKTRKISSPFQSEDVDYINILECYDRWRKEKRFLVYYEDLLEDFSSVMQKCLDVLNPPREYLAEFVAHFEQEKATCKELYKRQGGSYSGDDPKYYQKNLLAPETARMFDRIFKTRFPYIWNYYLKRYEVQNARS